MGTKAQLTLARVLHSTDIALEVARSRDGSRLMIEVLSKAGDGRWRPAGGTCGLPWRLLDSAIEALQ